MRAQGILNDSARLPESGRFFQADNSSTGWVNLPNYEVIKVGAEKLSRPRPPLTYTNCHRALRNAINKARLIGFEIARTKQKFSLFRRSNEVVLQGEARRLDVHLSDFDEHLERRLDLEDITQPPNIGGDLSLAVPFSRLLSAHDSFKQANGNQLKRCVLRIEKNFVQNIVESLKQSFIREETPAFPSLFGRVYDAHSQFTQAARDREGEVKLAVREVQASPPWLEVMGFATKINALCEQARSLDREPTNDNEYQTVKYRMFDRADGPTSVIICLERIVRDAMVSPVHPLANPLSSPALSFRVDGMFHPGA
ncbi:hypothetical protein H2204_014471 [Knufia peltigerae]|uniref:Uncharacterized protein n=1 Tax=Knufia peltigerae TaxID=1002370 RepID=A0AA38XJR8_9EURO|nr:hypothetical protein H2204_014471 [Knufia peltigerae]